MDRRNFLKSIGAAAAGAAFSSRIGRAAKSRRPNVILMMADDFGYECLSCNGGSPYKTPMLDRLAAEGIQFTNCCAQPLCTPSRVKIMTGRYNFRNYLTFGILKEDETTFGHVMKKAGYKTCIVGKWQLGRDRKLINHFGFDEYCLWWLENRGERYTDVEELMQNGKVYPGAKGQMSSDAGPHVPFVAYWPAGRVKGAVLDDPIDFSDFLPTIAELGGAGLPKGVTIDGASFAPRLRGDRNYKPRDYSYICYYGRKRGNPTVCARGRRYHLLGDGNMYDFLEDPLFENPIPMGKAKAERAKLQAVIDRMEIEPLIAVLLTVWRAGAPITKANGKLNSAAFPRQPRQVRTERCTDVVTGPGSITPAFFRAPFHRLGLIVRSMGR